MDKRLVVAVDSWEADSMYPTGHYVKTLGKIGDRETETEVVLIEHDINCQPFSQAVYDCVPALPWTVSPEDLQDPRVRPASAAYGFGRAGSFFTVYIEGAEGNC